MRGSGVVITQDSHFPYYAVMAFYGSLGHTIPIDSLADTIQTFIRDVGISNIVLDMSYIENISEEAFAALAMIADELHQNQGDLILCSISKSLNQSEMVTKSKKLFSCHYDVHASLHSIEKLCRRGCERVVSRFTSHLRYVPYVRSFARRLVLGRNFNIKDAFKVETIIDEISNNAIEHGTQATNDEIVLSMSVDAEKIEITISNASNPTKIESLQKVVRSLQSQNLNFSDRRGRGLALVKLLSHDFWIDSSDVGTCVHVTKFREG
ncbi:MAG: ATP-binding protein [Chitinivibrionales bacterium]|nr:ATP-binding protein [Chitinivibrionales bacterium]